MNHSSCLPLKAMYTASKAAVADKARSIAFAFVDT